MLGQQFASDAGRDFSRQSLTPDVKARIANKLGVTHTARAPEVAKRPTRGTTFAKTLG